MDISKDIKKAIESQLPKEVGDVLSERLARLSQLETENETHLAKIDEMGKDLEQKRKLLSEHQTLHARQAELDEREKNISDRENKMDVHDAVKRADNAEKLADLSKEFVTLVFKSPVYRKNVTKTVGLPNDHYTNTFIDTETESED